VNNAPIDIAAQVILVEQGVERHIGSTVIRAASNGGSVGISHLLPAIPESGRASLILRPDPDTARKTIDITRIWGRDIRFDNIKVMPQPP
jgi:hypothetical protein